MPPWDRPLAYWKKGAREESVAGIREIASTQAGAHSCRRDLPEVRPYERGCRSDLFASVASDIGRGKALHMLRARMYAKTSVRAKHSRLRTVEIVA